MAGEEDARVGEDAAAVGQRGSEVCGGRAEGGEERRRRLAALRSTIGGTRRSWNHGGGEGEERSSSSERVEERYLVNELQCERISL